MACEPPAQREVALSRWSSTPARSPTVLRRCENEEVPATPPASTKTSLGHRLADRARERWPALQKVAVRFRGRFAYVDGERAGGEVLPLCRLRYSGSASLWGFAIYRASHLDYEDNVLPSGLFAGTPEEALDCACGLYLNDPSAWD